MLQAACLFPLFMASARAARIFCSSLRPALAGFSRFVSVGGASSSLVSGVVPAVVTAGVGIFVVRGAVVCLRGAAGLWVFVLCGGVIRGVSLCRAFGLLAVTAGHYRRGWRCGRFVAAVLHGLPSLVVLPVGVLPPSLLSASAVPLAARV